MKTKFFPISLLILFSVLCFSFTRQADKPTLYIIGDSTVKNGTGMGSDSLWGWGSFMNTHFDTLKINVQNHAIGGRSSRTFLTDGRWDKILSTLKKGDYVIMQFGHNDGGPLDDTSRARGTIPGMGNDSTEIFNPIRKVKETVYSYGWYMRKYVNETKAKGATAIICSPVPRNTFETDGTIKKDKYAAWAKDIATETGAYFIPLNDLVIKNYQKAGANAVKNYFPTDHTHTNREGAKLNAKIVVQGVKQLPSSCKLKNYIKK
ncbi:rhamnogalacturonan acetylesterase [Flavobacterium zepuense]|uniref:Rhamnogalacturonan acetylesterase n=1 Tax=Flavobacterium zepuense TaxID=2593302 RepID=A0A552V059_9FLAO|nr:rhamnogalacturonan acetylesterase [Flavobacterium zepuense]TRW23861.1 rhamnogalacturonan acetylesterase [Flavobacterium zepuense]